MEMKNKIRRKNKMHYEPISLEISPELSEFMGAYIGDGCIVYNGIGGLKFELAGNTDFDLNYFIYLKRIIKRLFHCKVKINNRGNELRLITYSKNMILSLVNEFNLPIGRKTEITSIPNEIYKNKKLRIFTLRGVFDTDGFVYLDKRKIYKTPYPRFGITTKSKKLSVQILHILRDLNFKNYYVRIDNRVGSIFNIELYGFNNLKKWMKQVGSSNKKHCDKINYALVTQPGRPNGP